MMVQSIPTKWILPSLIFFIVPQSIAQDSPANASRSAQLDKITQLIEQLGHDEFSQRENARDALLECGIEAFDALYESRMHQDAEVRAAIRWLLQKIEIEWNTSELPETLSAIVQDYTKVDHEQRKLRLERIRTSEYWQRFVLLAKIARYEQNEMLANQAAVDLIVANGTQTKLDQPDINKQIASAIGESKRITCCWIRESIALQDRREAYFGRWYSLIEPEFVARKEPGDLNKSIVRLAHWLGDESIRFENAEATAKIANLLVNNSRDEVIDISETADWLIARKLWEPLETLHVKYNDTFDKNAWLLFRIAESKWQQSEFELAQNIVDRANSLISDGLTRRLEIALHLRRTGYSRIAYDLLAKNIAEAEEGSNVWIYSRLVAAEWLHDQQEDAKAVETLAPLVTWIATDEAAKQVDKPTFPRSPKHIKSRFHYFAALQQRIEGNLEGSREHLIAGLQENTDDSDLLIAVFRADGIGADWRAIADELVQQSLESWNNEISMLRQQSSVENDIKIRKLQIRQLASKLNTWAWLSCNTGGDLDTALQYSKRSLQLRPDSPYYLDTLANCYRAMGKLDLAIECQEKAVKLAPESKLMKAQLESLIRSKSNFAEFPDK